MPAVRVDRLAASHQLYVLLLACSDDRVVSMFFIPLLAAVLHQAHQGLRVSPGVQDAFRISSVVEMMTFRVPLPLRRLCNQNNLSALPSASAVTY